MKIHLSYATNQNPRGLSAPEIQVISEALIPAAKEVFETMIFMDLTECQESYQEPQEETILGSITFRNHLKGCLTVRCGLECARKITANMLGMDPEEPIGQEETGDAIGEIANMILGSMKSRIQEKVGEIQVSIPSVVIGRELQGNLGEGTEKISAAVRLADVYTAELCILFKKDEEAFQSKGGAE